MDRILNKLRRAELKAQEMRSSISEDHLQDQPRDPQKEKRELKQFRLSIRLSCFRCHSF